MINRSADMDVTRVSGKMENNTMWVPNSNLHILEKKRKTYYYRAQCAEEKIHLIISVKQKYPRYKIREQNSNGICIIRATRADK